MTQVMHGCRSFSKAHANARRRTNASAGRFSRPRNCPRTGVGRPRNPYGRVPVSLILVHATPSTNFGKC